MRLNENASGAFDYIITIKKMSLNNLSKHLKHNIPKNAQHSVTAPKKERKGLCGQLEMVCRLFRILSGYKCSRKAKLITTTQPSQVAQHSKGITHLN